MIAMQTLDFSSVRREIIWPFLNYQQPNLLLINLREPSAQQEEQVHGFQGKK